MICINLHSIEAIGRSN